MAAGDGLLVLLPLLSFLVLVLAFMLRKDRLRVYEMMYALATTYGLRMRRAGAQSEPEVRGAIDGRPVYAYFFQGGKQTPPRIHMSVGHRFPLAGTAMFFASPKGARGYGSGKWARQPLTPDPQGPLIMGSDGPSLRALVEALTPEGAMFVAGWTQEPDFRYGAFDDRKVELSFSPGKAPVPNAVPLMDELAGLAAFLEETVEVGNVPFKVIASGRGGRIGNALFVWCALLLIVMAPFAGNLVLGLFTLFLGLGFWVLWTPSRAERRLVRKANEGLAARSPS